MPGSADRNRGGEQHSHDIELDARVKELLAAEFPEVVERYEEVRPLYGLISKLARIRRSLGITQTQLAERLGRPQSLISAIESGRMSPHVETLVTIARELGYDIRIELEPRAGGGISAPDDGKNNATPTPRPRTLRSAARRT